MSTSSNVMGEASSTIYSLLGNSGSLLLSIYANYQIASFKDTPQLRFPSGGTDNSIQKNDDIDDNDDRRSSLTKKQNSDSLLSLYKRVFKSIRFILSILGVKEIALILATSIILIIRSLYHLKLLYVSTQVENSVIIGKQVSFWKSLHDFAWYIIPTSMCYAVYNYLLSELQLNIRSNVTDRLVRKFTTGTVFYRVSNYNQMQSFLSQSLPGGASASINDDHTAVSGSSSQLVTPSPPKAFDNPDQILTNDIEHFSYAMTGLFSHVLRPIVDILVNAERLYSSSGAVVPVVMSIYLVVTTSVLNIFRGPMTTFTDVEQNLEGEFRYLIAKVSASSEEIAALDGGLNEQSNILQSLQPLMEYSRRFHQFRCNISFIDSVVARYWLMLIGWRIVGQHFFNRQSGFNDYDVEPFIQDDSYGDRSSEEDNIADIDYSKAKPSSTSNRHRDRRLDDYQNMSKTMLALSRAVGALIMSGKDVVKVFAYSEKLAEFEEMMDALIQKEEKIRLQADDDREHLYTNDSLSLVDVSVAAPNSTDILHSGINIKFRRGMHTVITGENGSGKSSILRVMAGLWPVASGAVIKPAITTTTTTTTINNNNNNNNSCCSTDGEQRAVLYLPQKPYLTAGSLRQQIIYPDQEALVDVSDELLKAILGQVQLSYLLVNDDDDGSIASSVGAMDTDSPLDACIISNASNADSQSDLSIDLLPSIVETSEVTGTGQGCKGKRQYSLDSVLPWVDILSGGEKQRLSIARVLYHKPLFALLDESTSAVNPAGEELLYRTCMSALHGCTTFITVSHRPQLQRFHQFELCLTRDNTHVFRPIPPDLIHQQE